jgi:hypothetical protein
MISPDGTHLELPSLLSMNPMGKDHVTALLVALLALDANGIAARAVAEASVQVANEPGDFKVTLVIVDDLMGGWTNRYAEEFTHRSQGHDGTPQDYDGSSRPLYPAGGRRDNPTTSEAGKRAHDRVCGCWVWARFPCAPHGGGTQATDRAGASGSPTDGCRRRRRFR